ncbi:MAG: hypothetical protein IM647_07465 [Phenylobacterium sp.]|uniref:hypothetical protein n=1 Tax=Phenylobacterium sp. TaxID=1871053 RepID=UPI0025D44C5D|nr:hypothetical protein [Phenylobacterium sp.]MCA6264123.1 hypothetical protein [Phenylobacterium sp.]MCA6270599.1 hypothetical protein [Phenylobacterium sp.]MCA6279310.1 hypothetical protein [Phenylobacterium sp.]MCA6301198.1 hypothetical protein [Phenylobacterium sp.]MCA6303800.1 hypothetical protein [Phenylobacterium sp.]
MSYRPTGRGHRLLGVLSEGPLSYADTINLLSPDQTNGQRRKAHYLLWAMKADGMIWQDKRKDGRFSITEVGWAALFELDEGYEVEGRKAA